MCCIYVEDFDDRGRIAQILRRLDDFGLKVTCGFKPDVYKYLRIDTNNPWGLKPTLYSVGQVRSWIEEFEEARLEALDRLGLPAAP